MMRYIHYIHTCTVNKSHAAAKIRYQSRQLLLVTIEIIDATVETANDYQDF